MMRRRPALLLIAAAGIVGSRPRWPGPRPAHAVTSQSRTVISGMARFEILSPTLIRVEYSPTSTFEDRPDRDGRGPAGAAGTTPAPAGYDGDRQWRHAHHRHRSGSP